MNGKNLVKLDHLIYNLELLADDIEAKVQELNKAVTNTRQQLHTLTKQAEELLAEKEV